MIAGPAGGWIDDGAGGAESIAWGRPVILLEDLAVALRTYAQDREPGFWVGCTIQPTQEGLRRLGAFRSSIPATISDRDREAMASRVYHGSIEALGSAEVVVFGISDKTRMALRMVAADYHMKRIAVGVDPPPVTKLRTFIQNLTGAPRDNFQRWWFTPKYDGVQTSEDGRMLALLGQGIQLSTVDYRMGPNGSLTKAPDQPSRASQAFAQSFTKLYEQIAAVDPLFADLQNVVDLLVLAAYVRQVDGDVQVGWKPTALLDETQFPIETLPAPQHAPCVANAVWKGNRLVAPVGGGVTICAPSALTSDRIQIASDAEYHQACEDILVPNANDQWRWD
jgi:Protein of unknown function (DUF1598)